MPKKDDKKKAKKADKKADKGKVSGPATPAAPAEASAEASGYSLDQLGQRLGAPEPALERAYRATHSDTELHAEGKQVASWRILEDGERLCAAALVHLETTDAEVQSAGRQAGLSREFLALVVASLLQLRGAASVQTQSSSSAQARKGLSSDELQEATSRGRRLLESTLLRLRLVAQLDPRLAKLFEQHSAGAATADELAERLAGTSALTSALLAHSSPEIQALLRSRHLDASDVEALDRSVQRLRDALSSRHVEPAAQQQQRAVLLDVLDGFCLLLLGELLRALRQMSQHTPKVRRPTLYALRGYFGARHKDEEEPAPPPEPGPA